MASNPQQKEKFITGALLALILAGVGWNLSILSEIKSDINTWIERTSTLEEKVRNLEKGCEKNERKNDKQDYNILYIDAYLRENFTDYKPEHDEKN